MKSFLLFLLLIPILVFGKSIFLSTGAASFTPASISGLTLWYDLQDVTKYTLVSGNVSQLTDKSASGNNATQGTAGSRWVYGATALNSLPAMTSDGTKTMTLGASAYASIPATIFVVGVNTSSAGAVSGTVFGTVAAGSNYMPFLAPTTGNNLELSNSTESADSLVLAGITQNTPFIYAATINTGLSAVAMYLSNSAQSLSYNNIVHAYTTAGLINFVVLGGSAFGFVGSIGEILVYNSVLGTTDRTNVYNYLHTKWGI